VTSAALAFENKIPLKISFALNRYIMQNKVTASDMSDEAVGFDSSIASYIADRQLMRFSSAMPVLGRKSEYLELDENQSVILFHEWMHFLQNTSTLHGVSAFVCIIELWNAFRQTTDFKGIGLGTTPSFDKKIFQTETLFQIFYEARNSKKIDIPKETSPDLISVEGHQLSGEGRHLDLIVNISNGDGDYNKANISLSALEIIESTAYLLEKRLLFLRSGRQSAQAIALPYHALTIFAKYYAPTLDESEIIMCGFASLQSSVPYEALLELMSLCEKTKKTCRRKALSKVVSHQLEKEKSTYLGWLDRLSEMFSANKSIAKALNKTVNTIRSNLLARIEHPFYELDICDLLARGDERELQKNLITSMKKFGTCTVVQEFSGTDDELERDITFEFSIGEPKINEERLEMICSMEYVARHIKNDGNFQKTELTRDKPCPIYTSCPADNRKNHPMRCKTKPWLTVHDYPEKFCSYAKGVLSVMSGPQNGEPTTFC